MKKLVIIITFFTTACTSQVKTDTQEKEILKDHYTTAKEVPLNNGSKWKADAATRSNVAEMVRTIKDSRYVDQSKREELYIKMQNSINSLVKQCNMKGAEHDALHIWLETILKDLKDVKDNQEEYSIAHAALKNDIGSFYNYFE